MITRQEVLQDIDYYRELLSGNARHVQCVYCAGWALTCGCEENHFDKETKQAIRILEQIDWENRQDEKGHEAPIDSVGFEDF